MHAPPARRKDARADAATRNRDPVRNFPYFQPRSPPRSGTSVKRGAAIRKPPPPSFTRALAVVRLPQDNSLHLLPLNFPLSFEFSATAEFSREERESRLVLTG